MTYDPGADAAARYPDWVIRHRPLGGVVPEVLCLRRKVILIETKATWPAKRCSLAHAVAHLDLGHTSTHAKTFHRAQEAEATQLAARRLLPLDLLADVLSWTRDYAEIAAELDCELEYLRVRHRHLHQSEIGYLRRVTTWLEETA